MRVVFRNEEELQAKREKMRALGVSNLVVVSDFDHTLSTMLLLDKSGRSSTSHGVLESSSSMSDLFRYHARQNFLTYFPFEKSTDLAREEKVKKMEEWWGKAHELLIKEGLTKKQLFEAVEAARVDLRIGCIKLLENLNQNNVPVIVFSAGIADVIELLLLREIQHENIVVFGNRLVFEKRKLERSSSTATHDEQEEEEEEEEEEEDPESQILVRFGNPENIHSMNKNESTLVQEMGEQVIHKERKSLILLGDNISDLAMADTSRREVSILIGFLNDHEERLESYLDNFDVVICGDGPMDYVLDLVAYISGQE